MNPKEYFDMLALLPNWRAAHVQNVDVVDTPDGFRFEGYAATYDDPTEFDVPGLGKVGEVIQPGAFDSVLRRPDNVPFLVEHNPEKMLATTRAGTLRLEPDTKGLHVQADVPDTTLGRDVYKQVKRGDLHGMSFGFVTGRGGFKLERRSGTPFRILTGFRKLLDVCVTWDPTYRNTEAQFRSMALKYAGDPTAIESLLLGAYPQLGEQSEPVEPADDDELEPGHAEPVNDPESGADDDEPEHRTQSLAARKRRLSLYLHEHGGGLDDASS